MTKIWKHVFKTSIRNLLFMRNEYTKISNRSRLSYCEERKALTAVNQAKKTHATNMTECTTNGLSQPSNLCDIHEGWSNEQISLAHGVLKSNKIIAVPTDTIYGIAGLSQSTEAVNKIYDIKGRNNTKPVSICVGDVQEIHKWGKVTSDSLLTKLLPGPVTVVLERTPLLNPQLNPGTSLVGIRVPDHGFVRDVVRDLGEPIALTSANTSGAPSTLSVEEFENLWEHLGCIFDGGCLGKNSRSGSTVVDISRAGTFTIIRNGSAYEQTRDILLSYGWKEEEKS